MPSNTIFLKNSDDIVNINGNNYTVKELEAKLRIAELAIKMESQ